MNYTQLDNLYNKAHLEAKKYMANRDEYNFWRYYGIANRILILKLNKVK